MKFFLSEAPIAKKRHRTCIVNGYARTYDPQEKQKICTRNNIRSQMNKNHFEQIEDGPVTVTVINFVQIPASTSGKKRAKMCGSPCHKRPDIDNYVKYILDVCNGIVFKDDGQVSHLYSEKLYSDTPGVVIDISSLSHTQSYGATLDKTPSEDQLRQILERANQFGLAGKKISSFSAQHDKSTIKISLTVGSDA